MSAPQEPMARAVDPEVLDTLTARLGDRGPAFRTRLVQTWRDETTARLADLDTSAASGDVQGVLRAAHTLKSSSSALGAQPLSVLCEEIELALRAGEERDLAADATALRAAATAADAAFAALWP